jgi:outer membrane protein assembly factor BamA
MARLPNMREIARMSLVLLLFVSGLCAQTRSFAIDSITVEGNKILSAGAIAAAAGLKRGDTGNGAVFDAARDRLIASGYFETVAYRYKPSATSGYDLIFEVKEIQTLFPIRVDALGVSTEEVTAYLKAKDPLFSGRMPETQEVLRRTASEIEQYLETKNHPEKVAGKVVATAPERFEIEFTPEHGLPAVATVTFEGSKLIPAIDLRNKIAEVAFGQPYTESGFRVFLENQIRPLYETKGYMNVTFPKIAAAPSTQVTGVDVKVTIDEGAEYKLTRVAVAGTAASESARILKAAKLPATTIANFDQIKEATVRVRDSLRQDGYLDCRVSTDSKRNDEKKTVEFFIVVDTGPEYTFGTLTVNGLALDGEAAIRKMWSVKTGDAFPPNYPDYFVRRVKEDGLFDNLGDTKATPKIDKDKHVVDVTLDFKSGPSQEKQQRRPGFPGR